MFYIQIFKFKRLYTKTSLLSSLPKLTVLSQKQAIILSKIYSSGSPFTYNNRNTNHGGLCSFNLMAIANWPSRAELTAISRGFVPGLNRPRAQHATMLSFFAHLTGKHTFSFHLCLFNLYCIVRNKTVFTCAERALLLPTASSLVLSPPPSG